MSLIMCKCCRREISVNAKSCPHCGEPMNYTETQKSKAVEDNRINVIISGIISIAIIGGLFFGIYKWISPQIDKAGTSFLETFLGVNIID